PQAGRIDLSAADAIADERGADALEPPRDPDPEDEAEEPAQDEVRKPARRVRVPWHSCGADYRRRRPECRIRKKARAFGLERSALLNVKARGPAAEIVDLLADG